MLTHGHSDGAYTYYSIAFWPGDSNFTISSICQVLRALKQHLVKDSKELFIVPLRNRFEAFFMGSLNARPQFCQTLPTWCPYLFLIGQLFCCKRRYSFNFTILQKITKIDMSWHFCSLLTTRRIFKEVTVEFRIVGHIHDGIDVHFIYLLKLLKMKNTYVLTDLMKAFMDS